MNAKAYRPVPDAALGEVAVGTRPTVSADRSRFGRRPSSSVVGGVALLVAVLGVLADGSSFIIYEATLVAIYAIVAVAQEWLFGRAGLVSLGPAAIMAVGAFTTARLSTHSWGAFPVPLFVSLVFGAVIGVGIGVPGLRFRGLYLMLTTLALQFVISFAAQRYQGTNNEAGFSVNLPHWGSIQLSTPRALFIICAVVLGMVMLVLDGMYRAQPGRAWAAMRQNEAAASVLGVNLIRWRLAAFVGSSAVTAVAGALYAYLVLQVGYSSFSLDLSLTLVVMVFIGGTGTIAGPIIGAAAVVLLPVGLQHLASAFSGMPSLSQWLTLHGSVVADGIFGLVLLLVLLFERGGIFGLLRRLLRVGTAAVGRARARPWPSSPPTVKVHPGVATSASTAAGAVGDAGMLLQVRHLSVTYSNGALGVRDISLSVARGEIVAVLGRNGAGKTTMLRGIGGFLRSERVSVSGTVSLDQHELASAGPSETFRRGAALVPERDKVFAALTVEEHLRLASAHGKVPAEAPCGFEPLEVLRGRTAGLLSGGERQMLALEVAWRSAPRLLLIDELSLGLAPVIVKNLMQRLRALARERGTAMIIVEQDAAAALRVADRVYVVRHGEVVWEGRSDGTSACDLAVHYLGQHEVVDVMPDRRGLELEVRQLRIVFGGLRAVDDLTLSVGPGELFGVLGPNGAGKTTLLNAVSGLVPTAAGEVVLGGAAIHRLRPDAITALGVGRTFQAAEVFNELRVVDYLMLGRFVQQSKSITAAALRLPRMRRAERADRDRAMAMLASYGLEHVTEEILRELPYGQRKLIDVMRALLGEPRLLLLDEPTSGTASEDRALLRAAVAEAQSQGVTVVLVDHDVQFVSDLCDRVLVMSFGSELGTGTPAEVLARREVRAAYVGLEDGEV